MLFYLVVFLSLGQVFCQNVVETANGLVQGGQGLTAGLQQVYYYYRGIPFAEPPVGSLRFEPPVPKTNWTGVLDATNDGAACIQGDPIEGSEDCLTINVYTPQNPQPNCQLLPTYVWIYGGAFNGGSSSYTLYAPDFLLEKNVLVVTFNYRLSYLGFLSTGDSVAPGNAALKDQVLALQWVQNNVRNFCGDPNAVTLGGESAGAASVAYHLQSPLSQGLFHRVIIESGSSLSLWALSRNVPSITQQIAEALGVSTASSSTILQGLKNANLSDLDAQAQNVINTATLAGNPKDGFPIGPVIEPNVPGAFFTKKSHQALSNGEFSKVPILTGFNSLEGGYTFTTLIRLFILFGYDLNLLKLLPADANVSPLLQVPATLAIKTKYFGLTPISLSNTRLMIYLSDDQFERPAREFVILTKDDVPVYFYRFSYEGGLSGVNRTAYPGVVHTEELAYYWKWPYPPTSPQDLVIRERFVTLITNFIRFGNPTPEVSPVLQNQIWPTSGPNLDYLDIGDDLVIAQNPQSDRMVFWDQFYATYGRPPYDTY